MCNILPSHLLQNGGAFINAFYFICVLKVITCLSLNQMCCIRKLANARK
jgi:hypothetical protein